eukprot:3085320-Amphidinium_carterae.1
MHIGTILVEAYLSKLLKPKNGNATHASTANDQTMTNCGTRTEQFATSIRLQASAKRGLKHDILGNSQRALNDSKPSVC